MLYSKIPVQILGATGMVGRRLISLLTNHPLFYIHTLSASAGSVGKRLKEIDILFAGTEIGEMEINNCDLTECKMVFSALDASVAHDIEGMFVDQKRWVFSNARNYRLKEGHILSIPEISHDKIKTLSSPCVITNPNCCVSGLALALFPLLEIVNAEHIEVVTQQSISGAGYPGVPSLDILNNIIPYIQGEEEKIVAETKHLLSDVQPGSSWDIYPTCTRVPVQEGHMMSVSVLLKNDIREDEIIEAWTQFSFSLDLYSATKHPLVYLSQESMPQPKYIQLIDSGMKVFIGRLRKQKRHVRFVLFVHNLVRGAAGGALLNAETWYHYHGKKMLGKKYDQEVACC